MTLAEGILSNPALVALLAIVLMVVAQFVREVGPREAMVYDRFRRVLWRTLDRPLTKLGRPLLSDKSNADDEYIVTVDGSLVGLLRTLWGAGFRWNPTSTVKFRRVDGTRRFALSVVYRDSVDAEDQQDVHIFRNSDGTLDVYGHYEPSVTDPVDHIGGDEQVPGDPKEIVVDALGETAS